ncbi:MAG: hypothetical protein KAJ51_02350, partial [Thermoplasmata archaeon]|nr:hypothetical protein [Thermoplasmata archaeon]
LVIVSLEYIPSQSKFLLAIIAILFLAAGTAIQLGTVMYTSYSRRLSERIDEIATLVKNTQKMTSKMNQLITEVLRGKEIKTTDEILNDFTMKEEDRSKRLTLSQLNDILKILDKNNRVKHPKGNITIFLVDRPLHDLMEALDKPLMRRIERVGAFDEGSRSLIYLKHEFSPKTIKKLTKQNPLLKGVNFESLQDVRKKLADELNKLGISYEQINDKSHLWKLNISSYDRNILSKKIRDVNINILITNKKLTNGVNKFIAYQSVLDTKIAVLCLAIAGVIGGLWDIIY